MANMRSPDMRGVIVGKPANMKGLHSPAIGGLQAMTGKRNRGGITKPVGFAEGGAVPFGEGDEGSDAERLRLATERVLNYNRARSQDGGAGADPGGGGGAGPAVEVAPVEPGGMDRQFLQPFLDQLRDRKARLPDPRALEAQEERVTRLQEGALSKQLAASQASGKDGVNIPLLRASAALMGPTKTGGFGESLAAAGEAGAGALTQQRQSEAQRADREAKLHGDIAKTQSDALERKRKTYETAQSGVDTTTANLLKAYDSVNAKLKMANELNLSQERRAELAAQSRILGQQIGAQNRMVSQMMGILVKNNANTENPVAPGDLTSAARAITGRLITGGGGGGGGGGTPGAAPGGGAFPLALGGAPLGSGSPLGGGMRPPGAAPPPGPSAPPAGAGPQMQLPPAAAPPPVLAPGGAAQPLPGPVPGGSELIDERSPLIAEGAPVPVPAAAPMPPPAAAPAPLDGAPAVRLPMPPAPPAETSQVGVAPARGLTMPSPPPAPAPTQLAPITVQPPAAAPSGDAAGDVAPLTTADRVAMRGQYAEAYKMAKADADSGKAATVFDKQLDTMEKAMRAYDSSGRTTGALAAVKQAAGGLLGIKDPMGVKDRELFDKVKAQAQMQMAKLMSKGYTSNIIEKTAAVTLPNLDTNSFEGNLKIIRYMKRMNDLDKQLGDAATSWASDPVPSRRSSYLSTRNQVFKDWEKSLEAEDEGGGKKALTEQDLDRIISGAR